MRHRRGVTLVELLIGIIVASILGAGVLSLMLSSNRFEERTESLRSARRVSRAAINALATDLRMTDPAWGIEAASATSLTVRVPYAMGVVCSSTVLAQVVALLPVDSVAFAAPGYSGFAARGAGATSTVHAGGVLTAAGSWPATCTAAGIQAIPATASAPNAGSRAVTIALSGAGVGTPLAVGSVVTLYRRTRYYFGASGQAGLSGRTALWRHHLDGGGGAVELAAPFDPTAAFRFYPLNAVTAQDAVPAPLTDLRGIELFLPGESDRTARRRAAPEQADLRTAIFFVNRVN